MPAVPRVIFTLICSSVLCPGQPPGGPAPESVHGSPFAPSTPAALRAVWLDFHGTRLCQDIDAVFVFHERGMEVWCLTESTKSLDRLKRMTGPLMPSYRVDLYVTRPQPERDEQEDRGPPPGLWNNEELRGYLGNTGPETDLLSGKSITGFDDALFTLKRRIRMYADQTLELSRRLERYAMDLQGLSVVAFRPGYVTDDSARARTLCMTHASGVEECASKLDQALRRALPSPARRPRPEDGGAASPSPASPRDMAAEIAREARKVTQRIYRFIYPDQFTVEIADLREPGLLESLAALRRMTADFQHKLKGN